MTSKLDNLLLLLDTGSSTSLRTTAAQNIAQLAAKSVTSDVTFDEDIKTTRHVVPRSDPSAWAELMAVVARILPYLHSKSHETRTAASVALSHICTLVPVWRPQQDVKSEDVMDTEGAIPAPEFPRFSVEELMQKGTLLLASSGKEFIKPAGIFANSAEVKKAKKEAMKRLGLDFLETVGDDDMDLEKELAGDADEAELDNKDAVEDCAAEPASTTTEPRATSAIPPAHVQPKAESPALPPDSPPLEQDLTMMSARERNRLKRKRKPGNSAFVAAPAPTQASGSKYSAMTSSASNAKVRLVETEETPPETPRSTSPSGPTNGGQPEKVIIDPSKGGAVSPKAAQQTKALEVQPGCWVWDGLVKILEVDLFSPSWQARHGAAMALRELLKVQGHCGGMEDNLSPEENAVEHERWCNDLSVKLLCIFVLDRFGDFVSDQVVAPVRETVSQTLASLLLHMPRRSLHHVHGILLQMIRQNFPIPPPATTQPSRGRTSGQPRDMSHVWEVRHAGLLGIKYEVAVRPDLFKGIDGGPSLSEGGNDVLRDVVDAAILGLGDRDDDVRSVAASCLLPVAEHVVGQLPGVLGRVLGVLWSCLAEMKDDLSSSVGGVMDLLGKLVSYDEVISILADKEQSLPITVLAPTLYPFFRHTIANVRLAVVKTLYSFMVVNSLSRDWIASPFLRLLLQNLVVEERADIREATLLAWNTALGILNSSIVWMQAVVTPELLLEWYAIVMTPMGVPINTSTFFTPSLAEDATERHNVDKNMLAQDLALVTVESVFKTRIAAATALAQLIVMWPEKGQPLEDLFVPILPFYIDSTSMLQKFLTAIIVEEWAREHDRESSQPLIEVSPLAQELSTKTLAWLQAEPPAAYHEMVVLLSRLHTECFSLLQSFVSECKLPQMSIPTLGSTIDLTGADPSCFSIESAKAATGTIFNTLKDSLGRRKVKELAAMTEKRATIVAGIARYFETKAEYDIRVSAAFAAAFIALKSTPEKVSPIVKGIMNGIKNEENVDLQNRSATAVANFVNFCAHHKLVQPPDKIVKNLCTFLCQDVERTPTFAFTRKQTNGILSFQPPSRAAQGNGKAAPEKDKVEPSPADAAKARISRRGAGLAFEQLSALFGPRLLDVVPGMWQSMVGGLLSACRTDDPSESDVLMGKQFGQDVIDSLSVLEAVLPALHQELWPRIVEIFPKLLAVLRSRYAIVRQSAARCMATVCNVMTTEGMRYVVENVVPLLGDSLSLPNRQGSVELMFHIVQKLEIKALPYVIFLVVPVLGRMSDPDDDVRSTSTNTFASLVKMVPLEAGLPDPPEFSEELLKRRETERQFLSQLLDGSKKVEPYTIPVKINAELRTYQQDGVNWLAFLAKYQLHGILCDDMGLGKTLQSICILAGKHHERAERYKETNAPDSVPLPSLIVCPPTLTGHWYYEIRKYAENLKPVQYVGNARDRTKLLSKLKNFDVVITSYEVVRNDVAHLEKLAFHYCILDEGHIIKNAKTKLTKAVKCIRADHRLVLSGTPIQNHALDLWSLFDFLMPGFLGSESSFNERFSKPILSNRDGKSKNGEAAALALEALHKQVLPFLLRRLKEEVLHDLPPKIIQDYYCELSDLQKHLYDDFAQSQAGHTVEQAVHTEPGEKGQQHVFQSLQYLRKLCNHPSLVLKNDTKAISAALTKVTRSTEKQSLSDIQHAPKLLALRQLLNDCGIGLGAGNPDVKGDSPDPMGSSGGAFSQHRALIFCQMKQMIDIIESDLFKQHMPSVTYMRFDGSTDANKRHAIVQTFNSDPSIDCLLLTTHVGGLGLTLTGADTVIFVEHDWNPMKDLQAMDRAHRIGQKKVVNVYRLITKGTLEEKIMGLQRFKLNIANSVVTQQNSGLASMDTDLVLDLFKRTSDEDDARAAAKKKAKDASQAVSQKNVLQGLEDLPPEEEYEGLDLSSFMSSLSR